MHRVMLFVWTRNDPSSGGPKPNLHETKSFLLQGERMQKGLHSASFELLNCPLQQRKQETVCVTLATDPTGTNLLGLIYGTLETAASRDPKHQFLVWGKNIFRWENRLTSVSHPSLACCPHQAPDSSSREGCACVPGKGRGCHLCAHRDAQGTHTLPATGR